VERQTKLNREYDQVIWGGKWSRIYSTRPTTAEIQSVGFTPSVQGPSDRQEVESCSIHETIRS
jgi:hypothetical protein